MIEITSDTRLSDPNQNFRVSAGPGAGKTHWLVHHIVEIIQHSGRLGKHRKIACLTYTNIGADTVVRRLGSAASRCFVGTVHSFLYRNIVKPYIGLIALDLDIKPKEIVGYDEAIIGDYSFLKEWKEKTKQNYLRKDDELIRALSSVWWTLTENDEVVLTKKPNTYNTVGGRYLRKDSALVYKKMAWQRGKLHPDDILFLSKKLLSEYGIISKVLCAKFPYLFVDEFQDSNPLQVRIFKYLADAGIYIGIIGDAAQSIYGFNGASPDYFKKFSPIGIKDYVISQNRRSSNEIIGLLNHLRQDIQQIPVRQVNRGSPELLIGTKQAAQSYVKELLAGEVTMLSRNNETVQELRTPERKAGLPKLFIEMAAKDTNFERRELVRITVTALAQARVLGLAHSVKGLPRILASSWGVDAAEKYATVFLLKVLEDYADFCSLPLTRFLDYLRECHGLCFTGLAPGGSAKSFYDTYLFSDMAKQVLADDKASNRTIHKSKGDEFENVLLFLDEKQANIFTGPAIFESEEQRITYVALSRARDRLFINITFLSDEQRNAMPASIVIKSV